MLRHDPHQVALGFVRGMGFASDDRIRAVLLIGSNADGQGDAYSDVDIMVVVSDLVSSDERLTRLLAIGCHDIMLAIAGQNNPALPVQAQTIDKFIFEDIWFDVSYNLPDQLGYCFDFIVLLDKDGLASQLCDSKGTYPEAVLKARVQSNLRLLYVRIHRYEKYARRGEWIGIDLSAINRAVVDTLMVLNGCPNYNRHASRISRMLRALPIKPGGFEKAFLDILHLDDRIFWQSKTEMMYELADALQRLSESRWGQITMIDDDG
ncbi:MAG: aminoglycoside 6-adenylyltransferase [Chloroflexi bacterium]|nr:aminoglycoside 6-adenylyltransferase [Chloroflexota bacterium]